jgi:predicted esterase
MLAGRGAVATGPGWQRTFLDAGTFVDRYLPASLTPGAPAPVVVFLHGAGTSPGDYRAFLAGPAETARCVVLMPRSAGVGWGAGADDAAIAESLARLRQEIAVDEERVAIAGHSAGAAYAYLLAYARGEPWSGVFTLGASYYPIGALADPARRPPIRMYYGTLDPNYTNGAYTALRAQWQRLGVPSTEDVRPGYGHGGWPEDAMAQGLLFLVGQRLSTGPCVSSPTRLCVGGGRFALEVEWSVGPGQSGVGQVVPMSSADAGLFWFFAADNWELLARVLDGCAVNGHRWLIATATTDVGFTITASDLVAGPIRRYEHPAGEAAPTIVDVDAFSCAPAPPP